MNIILPRAWNALKRVVDFYATATYTYYDSTHKENLAAMSLQKISADKKMNKRYGLWAFWLSLILMVIACGIYNPIENAYQSTSIALIEQQTSVVGTIAAFTQSALQLPASNPLIFSTSQPESTSTLSPISKPPAETPSAVDSDPEDMLSEQILASKILLFEDLSASRLLRYVKQALDDAGLFYLDVGSAQGWFKNQLLSSEDWDLIIAAAEARRGFGGEYFNYLNQRVEQGAAAIVEYYDFDLAPNGYIKPLFDQCGIEFQSDWYEPDLRSVYWLAQDHPILLEPDPIRSYLRNAAPIWHGDIGDLLEIKMKDGSQVGDATLVAGLNPNWITHHGVLASCLGGRMIVQSFSSHEYAQYDMLPLWQNYVYNALRSKIQQFPIEPVLKAEEVNTLNGLVTASPPPNPENGIGKELYCGEVLTARVSKPPELAKDMFEHHAQGIFLTLELELQNLAQKPVQIWDQDYIVEGIVDGNPVKYSPHPAATGYLYIDSATNLSQDRIQPGLPWKTRLAFDVAPDGEQWVLVVKPGSKVNSPLCEVRIPLSQ